MNLIDRDEMISVFREAGRYQLVLPEVTEAIRQHPTVDAVPVVRCKECDKFAIDTATNRPMCIRLGEIRPNGHVWGGIAVNENHYCGYGRRRKDDAQ